MTVDILLAVAVTSVIQSIFGVGVLLFGTPILLLLGYEFVYALTILLPISIAINVLQIVRHHVHVDRDFYAHILIYTIPFVVLFLFLVTTSKINIAFLIGVFLLFVALKSYSAAVERYLESLVRYERIYLVVMGIVHGLTNLGGSLLTAIVHAKGYPKDVTRVTVASAYATFAIFQILTLLFALGDLQVNWFIHGIYLTVGAWIYICTEEMLYVNIDNEKYGKIFAIFLLTSGLLLIGKSL
ncbi:MAG: TSUP family transporter [Gammaproteobacteria bacterium]